ncbi:MAG: hypothetical protein SVR08_18210 [Spirochaetota bacterium]|nr:hypothetical protein [Spirochaetota bacterium]
MKGNFLYYLCSFSIFIFIIACSIDEKGRDVMSKEDTSSEIASVTKSKWDKLSQKKIYFGHMSVGYNIMDGVSDIIKENPDLSLNIVETNNKEDFRSSIFAHSKNGENTKPKTKIDAFVNLMENGLGNKVDIAFFKLCYVDILKDTDVDEVFNYYKTSMKTLKKKFPKTLFIHTTAPLTAERMDRGIKIRIKDMIKAIIGRMTTKERHIIENIKRYRFNELIRNEYSDKIIFDLAKIESTYPDGKREVSEKDGNKHYALIPAYTYDGGHLNERGRKIIAEKLLVFLAEL